ncbi:MAG: phosphomannomutase [Candidatus Omnitrophota bacterium]
MNELKFGTSGLRDTVENMTDMECYVNARGFIAYLKKTGEFEKGDCIAIGGDRRPSTYKIKRAVAAAIYDMGGMVDDQGRIPSPALAYYAMRNNMASIMVTGSHIPADRNGIKFTKRTGEILKSDEPDILENVKKERVKVYSTRGEGSIFDKDGAFKAALGPEFNGLLRAEYYTGEARKLYIDRYRSVFGNNFFPEGTKIFLYQHSAVGRDIVKEIFENLGAKVFAPDIKIGDEPLRSDEFVPVDTESVSDKTLSLFKKVLADNDLDIGITLDGDSDRPLLVYRVYEEGKPTDEVYPVREPRFSNGVKYITGDILGLLAVLGLEKLNIKIDAVCVPVSANDSIEKICKDKGIELTQTRIGSPFVIAAMNDSIGRHSAGWNVVSWESNGGFLTGTDLKIGDKTLKALPTRDAVLPLVSAIHLIVKSGSSVSRFLKALPSRFTHADRIKEFPIALSNAIISYLTPEDLNDRKESEIIKKRIEEVFLKCDGFGKVKNVNYTDGIRIRFTNGEISHLRPSGNAPEFRNYAIADSQERAEEMARIGIEKIIPMLAERIASSGLF